MIWIRKKKITIFDEDIIRITKELNKLDPKNKLDINFEYRNINYPPFVENGGREEIIIRDTYITMENKKVKPDKLTRTELIKLVLGGERNPDIPHLIRLCEESKKEPRKRKTFTNLR